MFFLIKAVPLTDSQEMRKCIHIPSSSCQSSPNPEEPFLQGAQSACGCCILTAKLPAASTSVEKFQQLLCAMKFTLLLLHSLFLADNCLIAALEIVGQADPIKSCAEPEFKEVWGLLSEERFSQTQFCSCQSDLLLSQIKMKFLAETANMRELYWQKSHSLWQNLIH